LEGVTVPQDELTLTPRYTSILAAASELARSMGHHYVGAEHLFVAIIRDRTAVPTQVPATAIDPASIEAGLLDLMRSPGYATPSRRIRWPGATDLDDE
jgi:ATP-dependent Clp protease ATP-binding subunit ClpA